MALKRNRRNKKKQGGGRYAALFLLFLIVLAAGGYLIFTRFAAITETTPPLPPVAQKFRLPGKPVEQAQPVISSARRNNLEHDAEPYQEARKPDVAVKATGKGRLAIIIDDMGGSMQEARSLARIGLPLTFSIIPGLHSYREVASFAASNGIEVMIHMPMQPKGWPQRRLEANGLLVSMGDAEILERLDGFMRELPGAAGANNHMGSEFTGQEDKMRLVLSALKGKGLFFIDSATSPHTVALKLSKEMGIKSGRRNVFLDNEQNAAYIAGQLNQAVRLAAKNGAAIAICHPHPATIKTLAAQLPAIERQGITLVKASQLVK